MEGEIKCASFSPDGILLAAARSDNVTHIYDSRMIERGVVHAFKHTGARRNSPGSECYGVVEAQWVESASRRLGLVTGGNDGELIAASFLLRILIRSSGCVRLWDTSKSANDSANGTVIAETAFDVGYFSLGDPFKGEMPLVV